MYIGPIVYESFECVAIGFTGANDEAWTHVIGVYRNIYPFFDTEPEGMDPLQQQLALKFLLKLRQNMEGWYPSISRVLLAVIGPYENSSTDQKRTAFVLLRDAVYKELQKLPRLIEKKPDKIRDFFPSSVAYDPSANTLTHSYFSGKPSVTALSDLTISDVDLTKESTWRIS